MLKKVIISALLLQLFYIQQIVAIDRSEFYAIFSSPTDKQLKSAIDRLRNSSNYLYRGYYAALIMKKSAFEKEAKYKLKMFREGQQLLEKEIKQYPNDLELRFIRLVIQEKSPKILKYNINIQEDKAFIISKIKTIDKELKEEIEKYSTNSKVILMSDIK